MANQTLFNNDAQDKLLKGVNELADAVTSTLGPRGRNVAISKHVAGEVYERIVLHDGVSVAKAIDPIDPVENLGASILREAALKQVDEVGDGTTVVIALGRAIYKEASRVVAAGEEPMALREGLEEGAALLIKELDKIKTPIKTLEESIQVATISAENKDLGKLVAETLEKVGVDGVVTVEPAKGTETVVEMQEGMQLDKGYASQYFVTDPDTATATMEGAKVLVTDHSLTSVTDLVPFFNAFVPSGDKMLFMVAPNFSEEVLTVLVQNKILGRIQPLCVNAPYFGPLQKEFLKDIATITGAKFISKDTGDKLSSILLSDLGSAAYISSTKSSTVITGGAGDKDAIAERIQNVRIQLKDMDQNFDKAKLQERLGKLTGSIAVIRVGGATEIEMKERKERVLDAVEATKAALKEGIVPGGETVYLTIRKVLKQSNLGQKILFNALAAPFRKLVENAGYDSGEKLAQLLRPPVLPDAGWIGDHQPSEGFDVTDGKFKNMIEAGIIDPALVSKRAIRNAVSVAIQLLTTGVSITPIKEQK